MQGMGLNQLLLFNAGWWVFATAASFVAAVLFWNKGATQLTGSPVGGTNMAVKMSGAGAIWGITLLLFSYFQPMKDYGNASRIVLITTAQETSSGPTLSWVNNDPNIVKALQEARDQFGGTDLGLELIYRKSDFQLTPEPGNTFGYPDPLSRPGLRFPQHSGAEGPGVQDLGECLASSRRLAGRQDSAAQATSRS